MANQLLKREVCILPRLTVLKLFLQTSNLIDVGVGDALRVKVACFFFNSGGIMSRYCTQIK